MSVRDRVWPILISVLAAASLVVVLLDLTFAARAPVVLAFAVIGPGMALVRPIRLDEPWVELVLAVVVSLCLAGMVSTATIYAGAWSPQVVLVTLVAVSLAAVLTDLLRGPRIA